MGNIANVVAGKPVTAGGGVEFAPLGTALPTDATEALSGFTKGGLISNEGLTEATERSTEKIRAWGGDVVKIVQTEFGATFTWTFIESTKAEVLKQIAGEDNVTITPATSNSGLKIAVVVDSEQLPHAAYVFTVKDGDKRIRICVPDGQITNIGEVTYADDNVIGYPVTLETFKNEELGGYYVKYMDDDTTLDDDSSPEDSSPDGSSPANG